MAACVRSVRELIRRFSSRTFDPPPLNPPRRVVVTGLGMATPLGCGVDTTWRRLLEGRCGVRKLSLSDLRMEGFDEATIMHTYDQLASKVVAAVPCGKEEGEFDEKRWLQTKDHKSVARFISYALCSADEALGDAKWHPNEPESKERTGVSIGGGTGCISDILDAAKLICEKRVRRLSPFFIPRILINMAAGHVSIKYGFRGPNHSAVTACATGAHSVGDAMRMIQFGDADVMVAGGTESSIDALSVSRALATKYNSFPEVASRPFDCGRDGFVIGEGCGILILENSKVLSLNWNRNLIMQYKGGPKSMQKFEDMECQVTLITLLNHIMMEGELFLLCNSGLLSSDIDYINAHATSTPLGDAIEAKSIEYVFANHATSGALALSSTKGATGHLLGAAGSVEAIFSVLAIHHGIAPLTINLEKPDPCFHGSFTPLTASKEMPIRASLSNSFGFGGTNASLLFTSPP
ncbi:hypothetical protein IEQ34_019157 [Dendrobium chrysotoxum]|uniref:beta-ketoacyl-[acyl-carrier-protein] synthase I n=1 Tax=Dendrobium chrysotoxum TaxID=161865 RepID=A0AAV7G7W6_DENCH|nr:hypothetical protein IEQ34_019157 [Dendrobium chrysotoxum]